MTSLRKKRLKAVFEGRKAQLDAASDRNVKWSHLSLADYCKSEEARPDRWAYGEAVRKYVKARTAWKHFRGYYD